MASFDGVDRKFDRGVFHLGAFDDELARVVDTPKGTTKSQEMPLDREVESESKLTVTYLWRVGHLPQFENSDCSVIVGDALNNFRSSLDHLAWMIVKRHGTPVGSLKTGRRNKIQFPLAKNRGAFPQEFRDRLPGVDVTSDIGRLVTRFQPYERGNKAGSLRALRNLTNRDKHRLLVSAFWHVDEMELKLEHGGWSVLSQEPLIGKKRALKTGAPVVRAELTPISVNPSEVQLYGKGTLQPGLSGGWYAIGLLKGVRATVAEIIKEAKSLL